MQSPLVHFSKEILNIILNIYEQNILNMVRAKTMTAYQECVTLIVTTFIINKFGSTHNLLIWLKQVCGLMPVNIYKKLCFYESSFSWELREVSLVSYLQLALLHHGCHTSTDGRWYQYIITSITSLTKEILNYNKGSRTKTR